MTAAAWTSPPTTTPVFLDKFLLSAALALTRCLAIAAACGRTHCDTCCSLVTLSATPTAAVTFTIAAFSCCYTHGHHRFRPPPSPQHVFLPDSIAASIAAAESPPCSDSPLPVKFARQPLIWPYCRPLLLPSLPPWMSPSLPPLLLILAVTFARCCWLPPLQPP